MTKGERISKLESRMTTAEELLAELRGREAVPPAPIIANLLATAEGVVGLEAGQRYIKLIESQLSESVSEVDRLRAELAEVTKERDYNAGLWVDIKLERDALQARIDAGVDVTLTGETARIIDRQLIAQDERKGDRRRHKEETTRDEESGIRYWFDKSHHIRDEQRTKDRRRTPGTRADRGKNNG